MLYFKFCSVFFFLVTRSVVRSCIWYRVFQGVAWLGVEVYFNFFCVWNLQTVFPLKPLFSRGTSFFVSLFVRTGLWVCAHAWKPCFGTARVMAGQDYIKFEFVRTWLLSSGFVKLQRFRSEFIFFSDFVQFNFYCLRKPCWIDAFEVLVFHWAL